MLTLTAALAVSCAHAEPSADAAENGAMEEERIRVPLNQILVLEPADGVVVPRADLGVKIASGYGVLTFVSLSINDVVVVKLENIEAGGVGLVTLPGKALAAGENVLLVKSWHQMPGQTHRMAKFTHPPITFTAQ